MEEEELKADYNFTEQELYSITRTMCASAKEDIAALNDFSDRYDIAYVDAILADVDAAEALPDEDERSSPHEQEYVELGQLNDVCLSDFRKLERYIEKAFDKSLWKIKSDAAGGTKYRKAFQKNWEFTEAMNKNMHDFVTDVATNAALVANNNMPATFVAKVTTDKANFHTKYDSFKTKRQTSDETQAKLTANNGVFAKLQELSKDGQVALESNEGKVNRYIITKVKDLVSPPGSASLEVEVQSSMFEPMPDAVVKIQAEGKAAISAKATVPADGSRAVANFPNVDPARYTYSVYANETATTPLITGSKDVNKGRNARLKVVVP
jgi:hypothetical protein